MNNKKIYNKNFNLNQKSDFYLMNNYGDGKMVSDAFNSDLITMDNSIDYEKDDYFDNLEKTSKKFYFPEKAGFIFKQNKYI